MRRAAFAAVLLLLPLSVLAQQQPVSMDPSPTGFVDQRLSVAGVEHRYVVYLPPGYAKTRKWPLLVFLNGRGECGTDGRRQAEVGLGAAIRKQPDRWPFVVVFPQKPDKSTQWEDHEDLVLAVTARAEADYAIDASRQFLTGLSQGGAGSWALGAKHAGRWAAVAPVCGYRMHELPLANLRAVPVWAFHGDADKAVPVAQSRELSALLRKAGGNVCLSVYEGVGHNSWDRAYQDSFLAEWFLAVPKAPALAAVLADPSRVDAVRIRIDVAGSPSDDDVVERAGIALRIDAGKDGLTFSCGSPDVGDGAQSRVLAGDLRWNEHSEAGPVVLQTLSDLVRSPAWGQLAGAPSEGVGQVEHGDPRVRVSIELDGAVGKSEPDSWQGRAAVGAGDPGLPAMLKTLRRVRTRILRRLK